MNKRQPEERALVIFTLMLVLLIVALLALSSMAAPGASGMPRSPLATMTPSYFDYLPLIQCGTCLTVTPIPTSRPTLPAPTDTPTPTVRPTLPAMER